MAAQQVVELDAWCDQELRVLAPRVEGHREIAPACRHEANGANAREARARQLVAQAQIMEDADGAGRNAIAAGLVARKFGSIDEQDTAPAPRERSGGRASRRSRADNNDIVTGLHCA